MFFKGAYDHDSKQAVNQETYLKECNYLLSQISFEWKRFVLAKRHYSYIVQECLTEKNLPFVSRVDNPPNLVQLRSYGP